MNGEKNSLLLNVENKSGRNVTLVHITGSVSHPETNRLVKNVCQSWPFNLGTGVNDVIVIIAHDDKVRNYSSRRCQA